MKLLVTMNTVIILFIMSTFAPKPDPAKTAAQHIVKINTLTGTGTGFYVMYKGKSYLISNRHVCGHSNKIKTVDGWYDVLALSDKADLCLISSDRITGLPLARHELQPLDKVTVIGYPLGQPVTVRKGRYVGQWATYYLISVAVFGGNSGSPLLNEHNRVSGVVFATNTNTDEDAIIVTKAELIEFLEANKRTTR